MPTPCSGASSALDGLPNLQALGKLLIGETPVEILDGDAQARQAATRMCDAATAVPHRALR
jgi:bacterioferritin (cytochrome b1)